MNTQNLRKLIGRNLSRLRRKRGLTQERLAEKIEVAVATLARYESGSLSLKPEKVEELAIVLGVSPQDFFQPISESEGGTNMIRENRVRRVIRSKEEDVITKTVSKLASDLDHYKTRGTEREEYIFRQLASLHEAIENLQRFLPPSLNPSRNIDPELLEIIAKADPRHQAEMIPTVKRFLKYIATVMPLNKKDSKK